MTGRLWLDGQACEVLGATFAIHILTEEWDGSTGRWVYGPEHACVHYSLRVEVDEHSGEDGAPQPEASFIPVQEACGGRHPSLAELGHLDVTGPGDGWWEAFYGNDAPELRADRLRFLGWCGGALRVRWEAEYDGWGDRDVGTMVYEGEAAFEGLWVRVTARRGRRTLSPRDLGRAGPRDVAARGPGLAGPGGRLPGGPPPLADGAVPLPAGGPGLSQDSDGASPFCRTWFRRTIAFPLCIPSRL